MASINPAERFDTAQIAALAGKLDGAGVRTRQQAGRTLSYIEGWKAIEEANRIFGFGNWSSEVTELWCLVATDQGTPNYQGQSREGYLAAYRATVRVTVHHADGAFQQHSDVGYGEGIDYQNVGQAHESAVKEAVTDAEKRALRHWGNPFGLALYDKSQENVDRSGAPAARPSAAPQSAARPAQQARPSQQASRPAQAASRPSQAQAKAETFEERRAKLLPWSVSHLGYVSERVAMAALGIDRIEQIESPEQLAAAIQLLRDRRNDDFTQPEGGQE